MWNIYIFCIICALMDFNSLDECFVFMFISVLFSFIWFRVKFRVRKAIETIFVIESLHFFFPSSVEFLIGLSTCQEHQMSVTWSNGNFVASGNFGSGGTASGADVAVGTALGGHHPSLLLSFYRWDNSVPIHTYLPLVLLLHWGLLVLGSAALILWGVLM